MNKIQMQEVFNKESFIRNSGEEANCKRKESMSRLFISDTICFSNEMLCEML